MTLGTGEVLAGTGFLYSTTELSPGLTTHKFPEESVVNPTADSIPAVMTTVGRALRVAPGRWAVIEPFTFPFPLFRRWRQTSSRAWVRWGVGCRRCVSQDRARQ